MAKKRKVTHAVMEICSGRGAWHSFNNKKAAERAAATIRANGCTATITRSAPRKKRSRR